MSGTVTLDGEPLEDATLIFQPESGRPAYAVTDADGFYELQYSSTTAGAMVGKHLVYISTYREGDPAAEDPELRESRPERVPVQYNRDAADNPDMTIEVQAGSNTVDFPLTSEGEIYDPQPEPEEV